MKKLIKWLLRIFLSLVVLVIIAAIVLPMVLDPNDYKDEIAQHIEQTIGRQAHLNGEIEWSVFPWLALTFNDVSIDNANGFKGNKFANIEKLSARVKLLPLISKNIEVGKVIINKADLTLQVAGSGKSNWQSIIDRLGEDSDENNTSESSASLNIEGIKLSEININYKDAQTDTQAVISQFSLNTSKIAQDTVVNADMFMHLQVPDTGMDVDIDSDLVIQHMLSDSNMVIELKDLQVSGKMSSDDELAIKLQLEDSGIIDLEKNTISLPKLAIKAGDASITTNILGNNINTQGRYSGEFDLSEFDLNTFFKQYTGEGIVSSDVFDAFSSNGKWELYKDSLKIDKLAIKFDKSTATGNINFTDLNTLKGKFNLSIDSLDVDKFLADEAVVATKSEDQINSQLDFGQLTGMVKINKLHASGTTMDNMSMQVKTNGPSMILDPVKADFYQGELKTNVVINTNAEKNKIIVGHTMSKIQAGPLLTDLAGSELLTGIGDLTVDIKIDEPFSDIPLKSAHGHIDYQLGNGAIYGIDVFGMMQQGLTLLYPEIQTTETKGVKKTTFAFMKIEADVKKGILQTNILRVESPYLVIDGDIKIDLANMSIDGTIEPKLLDIPEQLVSEKYKKLLNIAIPVSLSGSLLEPKVKIDAKQLILNTQKEKIEKEKEKLKGKLLDSLFGKNKEKESN